MEDRRRHYVRKRPITKELVDKVAELSARNLRGAEIASAVGRSVTTVNQIQRRYAIPHLPRPGQKK